MFFHFFPEQAITFQNISKYIEEAEERLIQIELFVDFRVL